jgi:hypothetical protein
MMATDVLEITSPRPERLRKSPTVQSFRLEGANLSTRTTIRCGAPYSAKIPGMWIARTEEPIRAGIQILFLTTLEFLLLALEAPCKLAYLPGLKNRT